MRFPFLAVTFVQNFILNIILKLRHLEIGERSSFFNYSIDTFLSEP